MDEERPLHADAVRHPPDRDVPAQAAPGHPDDQALEDLDTLAGTLDHLGVDADGVTGAELRHLLFLLLALELVNEVHRKVLSVGARGASPSVFVLEWSRRQRWIARWSPERS